MSEVNISLSGRQYGIVCDPGEESRVRALGQIIDSKLQQLTNAGSNEMYRLMLAALMLADELEDLRAEFGTGHSQMNELGQYAADLEQQNRALESKVAQLKDALLSATPAEEAQAPAADDNQRAALSELQARLENLAERVIKA